MPKDKSSDSLSTSQYTTNDSSSPREKEEKIFMEVECPLTLISNMSSIFFFFILQNKQNKLSPKDSTGASLSSKTIPNLTIEEFLVRVAKYSKIEQSTMISMFIYIMRVIKSGIVLGYSNVYRIILGACVLSVKFNEDSKFPYFYYAKIGGLTLQELSKVEYEMYTKLNFSLFITEDEFNESFDLLLQ